MGIFWLACACLWPLWCVVMVLLMWSDECETRRREAEADRDYYRSRSD